MKHPDLFIFVTVLAFISIGIKILGELNEPPYSPYSKIFSYKKKDFFYWNELVSYFLLLMMFILFCVLSK